MRPVRLLPPLFASSLAMVGGRPEFGPPMLELSPFMAWDMAVTLQSTAGYRENPLLAANNRASTGFVGVGADFLLNRLPIDANSFSLYFSGNDRRYLEGVRPNTNAPAATREQTFLTQATYKRTFSDHWTPMVTVRHLYADQVYDSSVLVDTQGRVGLDTVRMIVHGVTVTPSVRFDLWKGTYFEPGYQMQRQSFAQPLGSFWANGPRMLAGWDYARESGLSLQWRWEDRPFDDQLATDAIGNVLADRIAHFEQHHLEIIWRHQWSETPRFSTSVRGFFVKNKDREAGYFDFDRVGFRATARLDWGVFGARIGGRWSTFHYPVQTVAQLNPSLRTREDWDLELRLEWHVTKKLTAFAEGVHERQRSNVILDNFRSSTVLGGLEWEF
jgi:hypothetical protein